MASLYCWFSPFAIHYAMPFTLLRLFISPCASYFHFMPTFSLRRHYICWHFALHWALMLSPLRRLSPPEVAAALRWCHTLLWYWWLPPAAITHYCHFQIAYADMLIEMPPYVTYIARLRHISALLMAYFRCWAFLPLMLGCHLFQSAALFSPCRYISPRCLMLLLLWWAFRHDIIFLFSPLLMPLMMLLPLPLPIFRYFSMPPPRRHYCRHA